MKRKKTPIGTVLAFNIPVTLTIGTVTFIFAILAIISFIFQPQYREEVKFIVATLGAATGLTSAFFVGENIKESLHSKKVDRATAYISAWTSPSLAEVRKKLKKISDLIKNKQESEWAGIVRNELETNGELAEDVVTILNFLDEIAVSVEQGLLDETVIYEYFKVIFRRMHLVFRIWIAERQQQRDDRLYEAFLKVTDIWGRGKLLKDET